MTKCTNIRHCFSLLFRQRCTKYATRFYKTENEWFLITIRFPVQQIYLSPYFIAYLPASNVPISVRDGITRSAPFLVVIIDAASQVPTQYHHGSANNL